MDENLPQPEMVSQLPTTQPAVPAAQTPQPTQTAPSGDIVSQLQDAIGQYESGGDYTAVGKKTASGDQAYGKYQIMGSNIPAWTQQALGQSMTPEQFLADPQAQDKTANYYMSQDYQKYGNPQDVASTWFSGQPLANAGNASDVNGTTTPQYVQAVMKLMGQSPSPDAQEMTVQQFADKVIAKYPQYAGVDPTTLTQKILAKYPQYSNSVIFNQTNNGSSAASPAPQQNDAESLLGNLFNFAFPVVQDVGNDISGTSSKSALQQLGDLGLSALWFAPGIGDVAEGAIDATRLGGLLGETGTKIAGQAIGGAGIGYGADVASNLSQGKTGGSAFTPGLGTATGGLLGGVLGKLASSYSEEGVIKGMTDANNKVIGQTKKGANELADALTDGRDLGNIAATKGLSIPSMYDPETVAYKTKPAAQEVRTQASALNSTLSQALKNVPGTVPVADLEAQIGAKIDAIPGIDKVTAGEYKATVAQEMEKIKSQYGDTLSASDANELKNRHWTLSKFDSAVPNTTRKAFRVMGNTMKTSVEDLASKGGLDGVKEMNQYIGAHHDLADVLDYMNGTKAKGGRLGDLLQKHTLGVLGGLGGMATGNPLLAIAMGLGGEYAGSKITPILRAVGSSPIKTAILSRIQEEDPEIVQKILAYAKQTPQGEAATQEALSPVLRPQSSNGILSGLINKTGVRAATATQ